MKLIRLWKYWLAATFIFFAYSAESIANNDWPIIKRKLDVLYEGEKPFVFLGLAAPNIQANEDQLHPDYSNRFPDEYELRDMLSSINRVGARATRAFAFGIYSPKDKGVPFHVMGRRQYNEVAFRSFDLLLALCKEYDVRIIVPIIASQSFEVVRGVDEFAALSGNTATGAFWTNQEVKSDFKHFLHFLMNRKNTITGVLYKNDPAILAWQFGNEFDSFYGDRKLKAEIWKPIITQWQLEMASYIKKIDPNHLIMEAGGDRKIMIDSDHIDIISTHLYEYWNRLQGGPTELAPIAKTEREQTKGKKVLLIDEFGLATLDNQRALIKTIREEGISGGLLWSIRCHRRDGGFYYHNEGGTPINSFHVPGFTNGYDYQATQILDLIRREAFAMRGMEVPPVSKPDQPPILWGNNGELVWRGSTGASGYNVERTKNKNGPWEVMAVGVQDSVIFDVKKYTQEKTYSPTPLWFDETSTPVETYYYRVKGVNAGGETDYSNIIEMNR